jgi:hypothetical protein
MAGHCSFCGSTSGPFSEVEGLFTVIAVMRERLAAGEAVARMYQEPGLAWLERQAEVAEELVAERQAASRAD